MGSFEECEQYLVSKKEEGLKNSSINKYIGVIKAYGRFKKWDWVEGLKKWKEETPMISLMSDEEIETFLALACPPRTPIKSWKQWTTFYSIMAMTGMRPNEVAQLRIADIDFATNNFILRTTKTVPRRVPIPSNILPIVKDWIDEIDDHLFPSNRKDAKGKTTNIAAWHDHFRRRIKMMGLKKPFLKPYSLRHSYITSMIDADVRETKIMKIVGHKNIKTTMRYTHLTNKDVQKVINEHRLIKKNINTSMMLRDIEEYIRKSGILDRSDCNYTFENNKMTLEIKLKE